MNEMLIKKQNEEVKSYFDHIFKGYLANDIETLLNPSYDLDKKELGGCAALLAIAILSGIEQLGLLTSQKETYKIEKKENTELRIKEFCNDWMSKVDKVYKKSTLQEIIIRFFRHGIAHQFMPIYNMAITRHPSHEHLIESYEKDGKIFYILQVTILAKHFLESLNYLENKLNNASQNDPKFVSRFFRRLDDQRKHYTDKNVNLIKKAEKNLQIGLYNGDSKTTISGTKTQTINSKATITV